MPEPETRDPKKNKSSVAKKKSHSKKRKKISTSRINKEAKTLSIKRPSIKGLKHAKRHKNNNIDNGRHDINTNLRNTVCIRMGRRAGCVMISKEFVKGTRELTLKKLEERLEKIIHYTLCSKKKTITSDAIKNTYLSPRVFS